MIKFIVLGLAAVIVLAIGVVLLLASRKSDTFEVQRSIVIHAAADAIFPHIDDLHAWAHWSAYEQRDPAMRREHGGAPRGVGAVYAWDGNRHVGAGRMEIIESAAPSRVRIKLDFIRPFEGHNVADFTLVPEAGGTRVTWRMSGPAPLMSRVMQVVMDMDAMIGKDFEAGLAALKTRVEA